MRPINFLKEFYKNSSVYLLFSVGFLIIALSIFWQIIDEIVLEKETGFDDLIFNFFKNFIVHQRLNGFMEIITQFSSPSFIAILFPAVIIALFFFKQKRNALFVFLSGAGGLLIFSALKIFFARPRPLYPLLFPEKGFSFPSGHATFSFVFYGALAFLFWLTNFPKYLKILAIVFLVGLSFLIGISRIYLRVHYPSDVLAGFCLGYSWLFLLIYLFRRWLPLHKLTKSFF